MRGTILACAAVALFAAPDDKNQSELKVVKVEIVPNSEGDLKQDAVFQKRPLIELASSDGQPAERFQLMRFRSYRVIATVRNTGAGTGPSSFVVRTDCVKDGKAVTLGKTRIGLEGRAVGYACYDIFPAEGGAGDCLVRTVVEVEDSAKALEFKTTIN
jgi:hypothetical protein